MKCVCFCSLRNEDRKLQENVVKSKAKVSRGKKKELKETKENRKEQKEREKREMKEKCFTI